MYKFSAMNTPDIQKYIHEHGSLFWYIPTAKKVVISHELLIETIMNYGTMDDIRQMFRIVGIERVAVVFHGLEGRKKLNYQPEIYNFLSLILKSYASGDI